MRRGFLGGVFRSSLFYLNAFWIAAVFKDVTLAVASFSNLMVFLRDLRSWYASYLQANSSFRVFLVLSSFTGSIELQSLFGVLSCLGVNWLVEGGVALLSINCSPLLVDVRLTSFMGLPIGWALYRFSSHNSLLRFIFLSLSRCERDLSKRLSTSFR